MATAARISDSRSSRLRLRQMVPRLPTSKVVADTATATAIPTTVPNVIALSPRSPDPPHIDSDRTCYAEPGHNGKI